MKSEIAKEKRINLSITRAELRLLSWILDHYSDYVFGDDRPDHGWGRLKVFRENDQESKNRLCILSGKLKRKWRKLMNKDE